MSSWVGAYITLMLKNLSLVAFADTSVALERFQMVSLLKLARVTEEGVRFLSPHDGSPMQAFYTQFFPFSSTNPKPPGF